MTSPSTPGPAGDRPHDRTRENQGPTHDRDHDRDRDHDHLRHLIGDLEDALDAIRAGGVDAVMVGGPDDQRLYTLTSADRPYRVIVDEMGEGAATVSQTGMVLYANRRLADLLGCSRGQLLGREACELVVPADRPLLTRLLDVPAGSTARHELTLTAADGGTVPVMVSVTGLDIDGVVLRCLVAADLSARREAELELAATHGDLERRAGELERSNRLLARSSAQFSAAFEHAPVGMALVGFDRTVLRANAALSALIGSPESALRGRSLDALTDGAAGDAALFADLAAGRRNRYRCELRLRTAHGEQRWVTFTVARVTEPDGQDYAAFHIEDITERKGYEKQLQFFADHDPLTGLLNRRRFRDALDDFLAHASRRQPGALVLLDLDGFKYVNDTLGHPVGDALLQAVTQAMRSRLRAGDVLARLGGDEFAILLLGVGDGQARTVVDSLLAAVREQGRGLAGRRVRTSASAGVVLVDGTLPHTADELLANADLAMYAAKAHGRDCLVLFDEASPEAARSEASFVWIDRIREAFERDLFTLVAQPIAELGSGLVKGCELLLRMREGDTLVEPALFLEVAERHGLAAAIDVHVLRQGIALAGRHRREGFRWEINLASASLEDPTVPLLIERLLSEHRVEPSSIVFEITETALISSMARAQDFAAQVTRLGCGFALDDFGAGYAGFYYLKHLPLDYLKIDGEFIRDLPTDRTNQVIVQAIVAAARPLGKQTIAEYVTDAATLDLLREYGVDHAQGYHVGKPVEVGALLAGLPRPRRALALSPLGVGPARPAHHLGPPVRLSAVPPDRPSGPANALGRAT